MLAAKEEKSWNLTIFF